MGQQDLPLAAGTQHVAAFENCGWVCVRKSKKNHWILQKDGVDATLSIPDHKQVKRTLLAKQITLAGIGEDEYLEAFGKKKR
jgi:hypothetical protein